MAVVPLFVDATACTLHFLRCGVLAIDLLCAALSPCVGETATARQFSRLRRGATSADRTRLLPLVFGLRGGNAETDVDFARRNASSHGDGQPHGGGSAVGSGRRPVLFPLFGTFRQLGVGVEHPAVDEGRRGVRANLSSAPQQCDGSPLSPRSWALRCDEHCDERDVAHGARLEARRSPRHGGFHC